MGSSSVVYHCTDQDGAIREVGRGYELIKKLQALLQFRSNGDDLSRSELAQPLLKEALQSLNHALSILKSGVVKMEIMPDQVSVESGSPCYSNYGSVGSHESDQIVGNLRGKRRRIEEHCWTVVTSMPYDDGYQWRKYGEKKIHQSNFPRSYFRCTYRDEQGCQATKQVQQSGYGDPPLFEVSYTNEHTCNSLAPRMPSLIPSTVPVQEVTGQMNKPLQECKPRMAQLLNRASSLTDGSLSAILSSTCAMKRPNDLDADLMFMDLVAFAPHDIDFLLS